MSVQRLSIHTELEPDLFGDYVTHDDFAVLQTENLRLQEELNEANGTIEELRKDIADLNKQFDGMKERVAEYNRVAF